MDVVTYASGSFRDRTARVFLQDDRILRGLSAEAASDWEAVAGSSALRRLLAAGDVVATRAVSADDACRECAPEWAVQVLEHEPVPFVNYPYEWSFGMLQDAALLQLGILRDCLRDGVALKDATPYNIFFRGLRPTFIDTASFQPHQEGRPWVGYRQFCELFLIPLMLQAYRGIDFQPILRGDLEGLCAQQARHWFSTRDLLRPGVFTHVWMHGWLQELAASRPASAAGASRAPVFSRESIERNLSRLTRIVERLKWSPPATTWTAYTASQPHVHRDVQQKSDFVESVVSERPRRLVWDLGCNTGVYSRIAARHADHVVAMDFDHGCIELLYRDLKQSGPKNIMPLTMNLANPSPGLGWRSRERLPLEQRTRPDLVLCLGLIHHLVIGCHVPLGEFVNWLAELDADVVIEFPTKSDPLVQQLLVNKADHYSDYSLEVLKAELHERFEIERCDQLAGSHRYLLAATPRRGFL